MNKFFEINKQAFEWMSKIENDFKQDMKEAEEQTKMNEETFNL